MRTLNRIDGAMKALNGLGVMCGAACLVALTPWASVLAVPLWLWGGARVGAGLAQAATGWDDE